MDGQDSMGYRTGNRAAGGQADALLAPLPTRSELAQLLQVWEEARALLQPRD